MRRVRVLVGGALSRSSATAVPPSALASRTLVGPGQFWEAAVGEGAMGTVHARVRGPVTRGLRDLWAGAAGIRSGGCAREVTWRRWAPRAAGPRGRRPARNAAGRSACSSRAGPADLVRERPVRPRVLQTSEQETDPQGRVVTGPRSLSEAVAQKGLANFP